MIQHTPGPWSMDATGYSPLSRLIRGPNDQIIGTVANRTGEGVANARLIAAAPELLEALEQALPWVATAVAFRSDVHPEARENNKKAVEKIKAAIEKATGKSFPKEEG